MDANGCSSSVVITINDDGPQLFINYSNSTSPSCIPGNDGTTSVTVSGGIPPLTYSINSPATANVPTISGADVTGISAAQVYTVVSTDNNGCTTTSTLLLVNPSAPIVNIDSIAQKLVMVQETVLYMLRQLVDKRLTPFYGRQQVELYHQQRT